MHSLHISALSQCSHLDCVRRSPARGVSPSRPAESTAEVISTERAHYHQQCTAHWPFALHAASLATVIVLVCLPVICISSDHLPSACVCAQQNSALWNLLLHLLLLLSFWPLISVNCQLSLNACAPSLLLFSFAYLYVWINNQSQFSSVCQFAIVLWPLSLCLRLLFTSEFCFLLLLLLLFESLLLIDALYLCSSVSGVYECLLSGAETGGGSLRSLLFSVHSRAMAANRIFIPLLFAYLYAFVSPAIGASQQAVHWSTLIERGKAQSLWRKESDWCSADCWDCSSANARTRPVHWYRSIKVYLIEVIAYAAQKESSSFQNNFPLCHSAYTFQYWANKHQIWGVSSATFSLSLSLFLVISITSRPLSWLEINFTRFFFFLFLLKDGLGHTWVVPMKRGDKQCLIEFDCQLVKCE